MYGTQLFGQIVCGIAVAVASPSVNCSGGYATQEYGWYWSEEGGASAGVITPPIPPVPPVDAGFSGGGGRRRFGPEEEINRIRQRRHETERAARFSARDQDELEMILNAWLNIK